MLRYLFAAAALAATVLAPSAALAANPDYPTRPIKLVVPFEPGGSTDVIGRLVAEQLRSALGVSVVVENRGGGGGTIGSALVARAPADGYTLLLATAGTHSINPVIRKVPYDPLTSFVPVSEVGETAVAVVVNPSLKVNNLADLIKLSQASPSGINFASAGKGSISHMTGEMFNQVTGARLVHVAYKGAGPAMNDVLAGRVPVIMNNIPSFLPMIRAGKLKPLAVASSERSQFLPDVPTAAEEGVNGFEVSGWFGVVAPAGTPQPVIQTLHAALLEIAKSPEMKKQMAQLGSDVKTSASPAAFEQFMKNELEKWRKVENGANLQLD